VQGKIERPAPPERAFLASSTPPAHDVTPSRWALEPLPDTLSGVLGANRESLDRLSIRARTDLQAMHRFLDEYEQSPGTSGLYQREIERLLLWCAYAKGKAFSSLDRSDFEEYVHFLANPQPREVWCAQRRARTDARWAPFVGPLGHSARSVALAALGSFCTFLVDAGYLRRNPLALMRQRSKKAALGERGPRGASPAFEPYKVERFLDPDMWAALARAVESLPQGSVRERAHYERARFVCALLYLMAPRAGELQSHTMGSFRQARGRWWWHVVGKGQVPARLPVPDDMLAALARYRRFLGLSDLPAPDDPTPLLPALDGQGGCSSGITARRLNQVLKALFAQAVQHLPPGQEHKAAQLLRASAHWGRHTSITAKVDSGMQARYVQRAARHQDPRTTRLYTHEEEQAWHDEAQKQHLPWSSRTD
jgi:integrase